MEQEFRKFSKRVYITECARFEGYRRMKRRKLSSTVSLALLSLSIIAFNILQLCDGYEIYNQSITAVTIMLSVLVLVISLLVSYLNYSEKEMKYYDCGLKLSALCDEIDLVLSDPQHLLMTNDELRRLKDKYQRIIGECGINHIAIDYKRAVLRIEKNGGKNGNQAVNIPVEEGNPDNATSTDTCCDKIIDFLNSIFARIFNWKSLYVWLEWNILDVNFLYWLLALGVPIIAAWIIFKSNVFFATASDLEQIIPVIFSV